jgi:hypothetical protein
MNIVMQKPRGSEYYIACVQRDGDIYYAVGKCIRSNGVMREVGRRFPFAKQGDAIRKCKALAKMKERKRKYKNIPLGDVPEKVQQYLEVPVEMQVTPQEMVRLVTQAKLERYVIFEDVDGIEEFFDAGVEYIGFQVEGEPEYLEVHDKFGELRHCFVSRMSSVVPTERCIEAGGPNG